MRVVGKKRSQPRNNREHPAGRAPCRFGCHRDRLRVRPELANRRWCEPDVPSGVHRLQRSSWDVRSDSALLRVRRRAGWRRARPQRDASGSTIRPWARTLTNTVTPMTATASSAVGPSSSSASSAKYQRGKPAGPNQPTNRTVPRSRPAPTQEGRRAACAPRRGGTPTRGPSWITAWRATRRSPFAGCSTSDTSSTPATIRCSRCCSSSSSGCGSRRRSNLSGVKNMDPVVAGRRRSLGPL